MKKRLLLVIMILLLVFSMAACQKEDNKNIDDNVNTIETIEEKATPEPIPEITPTPKPRPVVTDIFATEHALYQVYEDGSYMCIGTPFALDKWDLQFFVDDKLKELGIPIIKDCSNYSSDYEFDYEVIDENEVDMDDYNSKYGDTIAELKGRVHLELANEDITVRKTINEGYGQQLMIYDTPQKEGLVYADTAANYSYEIDDDTSCNTYTDTLTYDLFEGQSVIDASSGGYYVLGLLEDGTITVYYVPEIIKMLENNKIMDADEYIMRDYSGWTDIVDIAAFKNGTAVGVKEDGTIVSFGTQDTSLDIVNDWTDIVSIEIVNYSIVGLKSDGTVVSTKSDSIDLSAWSDIKEIKSYRDALYGLTNSGKLYYYAYDFKDYSEISGKKAIYTFNEILNIENVVSADITDNGLFILTEDGQTKFISKFGAYLYTDKYNSGIEDTINIENDFLMVKKADSIDIIGANYYPEYPEDLDREWNEIKEKYYVEKDFTNGVYIFGDFSNDSNVVIAEDGSLIVYFGYLNKEFTYQYKEKIIDVIFYRGEMGMYLIALSEGGDIIILNTFWDIFDPENNTLSGIYKEDVIDMNNLKNFTSQNGSIEFLHNDGTVSTLDELSTLGYHNISLDDAASINEFNTFNDTYYTETKSLSASDDN